MFKSEIIVTDSYGANTSLDLSNELPISLNFNIADVKDPSKRDGSYSKTVNIPGTKTNNTFFEFMFEVNIATSKFNVNLKTPCVVYSDGYIVLKGDLRLLNIQKIYKNGTESIVYSCVILGQNKTLFTEIGEDKLEALDFSRYNHVYDYSSVINSWTGYNTISGTAQSVVNGQGYRYALANYGFNNFIANTFDVAWLRPGLMAKEYWDAIFTAAGKTYTSSFLTDTTKNFCKLFIPYNGENLTMSATARSTYECYVGDTGAGTAVVHPLTYGGSYVDWNHFTTWTVPVLYGNWNTDSGGSFTDPSNIYNTSTGVYTVSTSSNYLITAAFNFQMKFNYPATAVSNDPFSGPAYFIQLERSTDGGVTWGVIDTQVFNDSVNVTNVYSNHSFNVSYPTMSLIAGEKYKMSMRIINTPYWSIKFYDAGSVPVTTGTASISTRLISTSTFKVSLAVPTLVEGLTLTMNDYIPKDIKQKDFLMSIIRMFNLYVTEDKNKANNYIIEPRDQFLALGTNSDWTSKLAMDKPIDLKPMGEIDFKEFNWKYKQDNDYYNKEYFDSYFEPYGSYKKVITSDFLKGTNNTEIIFSPTPVVDNASNELIIPYIFNYDGTTVKPAKHNIRCLLWNGLTYITTPYVLNSTTFGPVPLSFYPFCGMVNTPLAPTSSIEYGVPNKVYYTTAYYTNNNLFNTHYSRFINEVTDRDSKIVTMYLKLDAIDIARFNFYDTVYIDDTYYIVNKIIDYNPLVDGLTKVELLKLKNYGNWNNTATIVNEDLTTNSSARLLIAPMGETSSSSRYGNAGNQLAGKNITSRSTGGVATGQFISIAESCYKIGILASDSVVVNNNASGITMLNSSGIIIGASGYNISLTNCKNLLIDPSVHDYVGIYVSNKTITSADNGTVEIGVATDIAVNSRTLVTNTNVTTSISYDNYNMDCTSGNLTVNLVNTGIEYTIKKTDATANTITIYPDNPGINFIDGAVSQTITVQFFAYTIYYDGTNWAIK